MTEPHLAIDFVPNKTSIPPAGTSTLHLKVSENATPKPYTLPISANISFASTITNKGGESFNDSASVSIEESSNITLTLLPPYTFGEQLTNFTNTYISPIIGIWTFLAGVGAVIAPLIIRAYNNRKQNKDIEY